MRFNRMLILPFWIQSTTAEKSVYEREVEELRQKCEKGCEEVEELRKKLEEVIRARDKLQEEVGFLDLERKTEQQEVSMVINTQGARWDDVPVGETVM